MCLKKKTYYIYLIFTLLFFTFGELNAQNFIAYVDRSEPEFAISGHKLEDNILTVKGTAYDKYSGIKSVSVSEDGGPFREVTSYELGKGGDWVFKYTVPENSARYGNFVFRAEDEAGNYSEITRNDIEIYNVESRLTYPGAIMKGVTAYPKIEGEPVRAIIQVSGRGYDFVEFEVTDLRFPLSWDGYFGDKEAPPGNYLTTVRAYNRVGQYTVTNTQMIVLDEGGKMPVLTPFPTATATKQATATPQITATSATVSVTETPVFTPTPTLMPTPTQIPDSERYRDVDINGYVDSVGRDKIVVNGTEYKIIDNYTISDDNLKPGNKVTGLGRYDITNGQMEITILNKIEDKIYNIPEIEIDKKIENEDFSGIVEAVGDDYIVVNGRNIVITEKTTLNCDYSNIRPGDFISGVAEVFSQSGLKAIVINKAIDEKPVKKKAVGHVAQTDTTSVAIDTDRLRFDVTNTTEGKDSYTTQDIISVEYLDSNNEALSIRKLEKAPVSETLTYYYGEVNAIFADKSEIVVDNVVHSMDENIYTDQDIADLEPHSYAALVDMNGKTKTIRVVQNAGITQPEDRFTGKITEIGEKDINGNTPVKIDNYYMFITDKTGIYPSLRTGMVVNVVKNGEEIISISEVPNASINTDDLVDFVGILSRISGKDNQGNYYITVNGVTYRVTNKSVINDKIGPFERGATISGTILGNNLIHAAVIKEKAEDKNINNTFVGKIERGEKTSPSEFRVSIDGANYIIDENTMVYATIEEKNTIVGVHDKGRFLAIRDYPTRVSTSRPQIAIGIIERVSAKNSQGDFDVTVDGTVYRVTSNVSQTGYISKDIPVLLMYMETPEGNRTLELIFADNRINSNIQASVTTGKAGYVGLPDESGRGVIYVDGFPYNYNQNSIISGIESGDNVILGYTGSMAIAAKKLSNDNIYADETVFSDEIKSISDMQTDGSYLVTLESGNEISLTRETLLNDSEATLEPGIVISGLKFGNMTYLAATYGNSYIDVRDAAFSGILEDFIESPDGVIQNITVNHREYRMNYQAEDPDQFAQGRVIAGSIRPGKDVVSMIVVSPDSLEGEVISIGGYVDSITGSDTKGERKLVMDEAVYVIPEKAFVHGNLVDGARVSLFVNSNTNEVLSATVVESWDQGASIDGTIESISSENISNPFHQSDWNHLSLAGIRSLVSDDTVIFNGPIAEKDTIHGYLYGEEREILALLKEDKSITAMIKDTPTAMKIGAAGIAVVAFGGVTALVISGINTKNKNRKKDQGNMP